MPELPDIEAYCHTLRPRLMGQSIRGVRVVSPFVVRSVEPPIDAIIDRTITTIRRLGKRVVLSFDGDLHLVIHLMIAGRFRWLAPGAKPPGRIALAMLSLDAGTLALTEAGTKKRASIHLIAGEAGLAAHDPGGIDVLGASVAEFAHAMKCENHTLKRALTDPHILSGIGNAYSDEILHAARLSPFRQTRQLADDEFQQLHLAACSVLTQWTQQLCAEFAARFPGPGDVTAFRDGFAVHGRFKKPCPVCGTAVQRVRYAENEMNYCPRCQTEGRVLADRSLSRLLKDDWPRRIEDLEG